MGVAEVQLSITLADPIVRVGVSANLLRSSLKQVRADDAKPKGVHVSSAPLNTAVLIGILHAPLKSLSFDRRPSTLC